MDGSCLGGGAGRRCQLSKRLDCHQSLLLHCMRTNTLPLRPSTTVSCRWIRRPNERQTSYLQPLQHSSNTGFMMVSTWELSVLLYCVLRVVCCDSCSNCMSVMGTCR